MTTPATAALTMSDTRVTEIDARTTDTPLGNARLPEIHRLRNRIARDLEIERLRATINRHKDAS